MMKTAKPSLFNHWVTSSHLFCLQTPQIIDDFLEREEILEKFPLIRILLKKGLSKKTLVSLLKCGTPSATEKLLKCTCGCGQRVGRIHHHCSNRSCPKCAKRRERKLFRKYYPLVRNLTPTSSHSLKFLTVSPKNYDSITGQEELRKAISKIIRRRYLKERIDSGLYVIETKTKNKKGEAKGWNIHAHFIIYSRFLNNRLYGYCKNCKRRTWIKQDKQSKKFYCSTRQCNSLDVKHDGKDSRLVREFRKTLGREVTVDIKNVKSRFKPRGELKDRKHALNYCLKYVGANKEDFANEDDLAEYIVYTTDRRLINVFGRFYDFKADKLKYMCYTCKQPVIFSLYDPSEDSSILQPPPGRLRKDGEAVFNQGSSLTEGSTAMSNHNVAFTN